MAGVGQSQRISLTLLAVTLFINHRSLGVLPGKYYPFR
jgi:hypothetical protein